MFEKDNNNVRDEAFIVSFKQKLNKNKENMRSMTEDLEELQEKLNKMKP